MLVPIKLTDAKEITSETLLSDSTFKSLGLKETHIEDFLRKNIGLIFEDDDETLLQHVPTAMNRDSQDTPEVRV
jgi:hypothetical protein